MSRERKLSFCRHLARATIFVLIASAILSNGYQPGYRSKRRSSLPIAFMSDISNQEENKIQLSHVSDVASKSMSRREALGMAVAAVASLSVFSPQIARADDDTSTQRGNGFAYRFVPPPEMEPGSKPVKTHLFEINWKSSTTPKYTFGITIDPVRINTLKEVRAITRIINVEKVVSLLLPGNAH